MLPTYNPNVPIAEQSICVMIDRSFDEVVALTNTLLYSPALVLKQIETLANSLQVGLMNYSEAIIEMIFRWIRERCFLKAYLNRRLDDGDDPTWCDVLYQCEFVVNLLMGDMSDNATDRDSPAQVFKRNLAEPLLSAMPFTEDVRKEATKDYGTFVKFICKMSIAQFLNLMESALQKAVSEWMTDHFGNLPRADLSEMIEDYLKVINESGIPELLMVIEEFEKCAFAICSKTEDVWKKSHEIKKKANIEVKKDANGKPFAIFGAFSESLAKFAQCVQWVNQVLSGYATLDTIRNGTWLKDPDCNQIPKLEEAKKENPCKEKKDTEETKKTPRREK